jgi:hypothetical protein
MPTDVLLSLQTRRIAENKERANEALAAAILPLLACLLMIFLVIEWPAFQSALILSGTLG